MQTPINQFKQALHNHQPQIGLWMGLGNAVTTDICAGAGFDWLVIDGEHGPNDLTTLLAQLQTVAAYPNTHPVVRVPHDNAALLKQVLDIGATNVLVPMVDTPEHAALLVKAMRYPPEGIRGVGAALARASRWNQIDNYLNLANEQMCLLVQAETPLALKNLEAIANTEGVDGVFFGPADLSASMGYRGQPSHPEVQKAIMDAIAKVRAAGKAAGILVTDQKLANDYIAHGANFVAVGVDTTLLVKAATSLAHSFKQNTPQPASNIGAGTAGGY